MPVRRRLGGAARRSSGSAVGSTNGTGVAVNGPRINNMNKVLPLALSISLQVCASDPVARENKPDEIDKGRSTPAARAPGPPRSHRQRADRVDIPLSQPCSRAQRLLSRGLGWLGNITASWVGLSPLTATCTGICECVNSCPSATGDASARRPGSGSVSPHSQTARSP